MIRHFLSGSSTKERLIDTDNPNLGAVGKEVKGRTHTYYQVRVVR